MKWAGQQIQLILEPLLSYSRLVQSRCNWPTLKCELNWPTSSFHVSWAFQTAHFFWVESITQFIDSASKNCWAWIIMCLVFSVNHGQWKLKMSLSTVDFNNSFASLKHWINRFVSLSWLIIFVMQRLFGWYSEKFFLSA